MKFKYLSKDKISQLPKNPGVYAFKKGREFLYIGKASNLKERVKNHFQQPAYWDNLFINQVSKIGFLKTDSEIEALILEANLIKKYQPKYNIVWKDSKNYFFVGITKENFPQIFITHQPKFKMQKSKCKMKIQNAKFIGPFVDGKTLKQTLKILRKVLPFRSCYKIPNRPCLWYHLGRCLAPCLLKSKFVKEIPMDSLEIKRISQRNSRNLIRILKEGENPVLKDLKREMGKVSKKQDFEEAAKIRDQIEALEMIIEHAKIFEPQIEKINWLRIEKELKEILKTKKRISRIEAYDISNIQGQEATGAMVTFIKGLPEKNYYRRFKIKNRASEGSEGEEEGKDLFAFAGKPNDVAMIKECLTRRLKHSEWPYPDLILTDGGRAQLNAALKVIKKSTSGVDYVKKNFVAALAKKENKLYVEGRKKPFLLKKLSREVFNLILQLRDEAHRFAISYHKKLREKTLLGD